ncbi:hypothetical protein [Corynebacterium pseudopelargi]|uniref:DUF3168 domain-containing protein n=1 Tax=Corynebacterium pseudopelargi TaxID=2080757 RepID=A0A3G6IST3_9CORY|nr:hypothetical protein [Corynebacterium pseudopelargi]AZA08699.1 hypothetical protein CPPEL_02840 [Corynebacterium pseudopelargi]
MIRVPDMLKFVIDFLGEAMPDVWVADALPPDAELADALPCVVVDMLPGEELKHSWGGEGFPVRLDGVALDVEVFAASRGRAVPVADQLRALMHQLPHIAGSQVVSVSCPAFGSREDLNPRVKVLGGVVDLATHS